MSDNENKTFTDKAKHKIEKRKADHLKSVQDGSILDYIYKLINFITTAILEARDTLSAFVEKQQENEENTGGELQ